MWFVDRHGGTMIISIKATDGEGRRSHTRVHAAMALLAGGDDQTVVRDVHAEQHANPPPARIGTPSIRRQTSGPQAPARSALFQQTIPASPPAGTSAASRRVRVQTAPQILRADRQRVPSDAAIGRMVP